MWCRSGKEVDLVSFFKELFEEHREWLEERVEDMLDECYEPWKLGSTTFYPSNIVKEVDHILWEQIIEEEADFIMSEWIYTLNHTNFYDGDNLYDVLNEDYRLEDAMKEVEWKDEEKSPNCN